MKLDSVHADCIWCGRRLLHSSYLVDCEEGFGPRPRSDEHIIPSSVFGKIITTDLCKCCNDYFGEVYDHALAKDQQIVQAAKRVGLKETDLWSQFEGVQRIPSGREIKISYKKGSFLPKPELQSLDKLSIPLIGGIVSEEHLKHFGPRLVEKVRRKRSDLTVQEIQTRVDALLDRIRKDPTNTHYDSILDETFRPTRLNSQITYTRETKPWETQWCLAKIIFELSQLLWSKNYRDYFSPVTQGWRSFLEKRACSHDGKEGPGIFTYDDLPPELAAHQHVIEGTVSETEMSWSLVFFGTARWRYSRTFKPAPRPMPDPNRQIKIVNPIGSSSSDAKIQVMELP